MTTDASTQAAAQEPLSSAELPVRRRVSRETRQLLTAALVALVALWVLARIRFPDQPSTPNPIPSVLSQLSPVPRFANLAGEIAELNARMADSWLVVRVAAYSALPGSGLHSRPGIRLAGDRAVLLLRPGDRLAHDRDVASDAATGLTIVERTADSRASVLPTWSAVPPDGPRYLMSTATALDRISLRPVFIASFEPRQTPAWSGAIWSVPEGTDVEPGAFLVTADGELAGLVVRDAIGPAIVPAPVVIADAQRLIARGLTRSLDLSVELRPLTDALAAATGAQSGLVVAWLDPLGTGARQLNVGDVVEWVNGQPLATLRDWEVAVNRLPAGQVTLRVWRDGAHVDLRFATGDGPPPARAGSSLGVTLRAQPRVGARVEEVMDGSAAAIALVQKGDLITRIGDVDAPTPAEIERVFAGLRPGDAVLLAFTREGTHHVAGLVK